MKIVNLGIIGCGWVTETAHVPVLQHLDHVRLYAACDTRDERLGLMERRFGIRRLYADWIKLISDPDVDAVLIATPADSHVSLAGAAIDVGKHVLVEKPLALTVADAEELAEKARHSRVVSMVGFNFRFHPLARELKATIERGAIGRPLAVLTTFMSAKGQRATVSGYETVPERGGGVFHNKAVHQLDLLRFLFDCEVVRGRAMARSESHPQDFGVIEVELANGVHVCGCLCDHGVPDNTYVVFGDQGKATVNFTRPAGVALYRREFSGSHSAKLLGYVRQAPRIVSAIRLGTPAGRLSSYRGQWQHFLACIETHSRAKPDFEDGLAVTRVVNQLLGSVNNLAFNRRGSGEVGLGS